MYLVYGLQKSGLSLTKFLKNNNKEFKIWDDDKVIRESLKKKFRQNTFFNPKNDKLNSFKQIFVSPGISLRQKKFRFKNNLSILKRDVNLYTSNLRKNQNIIAITGTNGKSTTTKLIGDILKKNNIKTFVGGNIGKPLCNSLISKKKYQFHVIELSSFQLETIKKFNSKISVITNLANDHLDRYKNINDYINQKKNILTKNGKNLISIDDRYSKKIYLNNKFKNKISFSLLDESADIFMGENYILDNYFKKGKKLYIQNISKDLDGNFNNQNILIAYICVKLLKLPERYFLEKVKNFNGLPFRSKVIFKNKKIKIINNSKSTNINSTINSIENYNNIFLILGGIAKENNFDILLKYKNKINCVYLFGKSRFMINKKLRKNIKTKNFKNLNLLVKQIFKDLKKINIESNILFAPACSSYDQYINFEHRGNDFTNLINKNLPNL